MTEENLEREYIVFGVGDREFLIPKETVSEIIDIKKIFPIPGSPDYIIGVIPLKGKIIPAIDLAKVYNLERVDYGENKLVVLSIRGERIGVLSDTTPFVVNISIDVVVDDLLNPERLYEELVNKQKNSEHSANSGQ